MNTLFFPSGMTTLMTVRPLVAGLIETLLWSNPSCSSWGIDARIAFCTTLDTLSLTSSGGLVLKWATFRSG